MIKVFNKKGEIIFSTPINEGAIGKFTLMKEDFIELPFKTSNQVDFSVGDYVDLRGVLDESMGGKLSKIYQICKLSYPTYEEGVYNYNLRLDAYYYDWNRHIFKYTPEYGGKEASWGITASLDVHLSVFIRNLNALGYNYNGEGYVFDIDNSVVNAAKSVTYNHVYMLDALYSMANNWNCDCWITDNVIHFGRCEFGDEVNLSLGVEASNITRSESKGTYATRIYAFGSDKNLPSNYRPIDESLVVGGVVQRRLMLPEGIPYIDADESVNKDNAIESILVLDDIYPRFDGEISDVSSYESSVENEDGTHSRQIFYQFKDKGFVFSKDYILEGQELSIHFESGKLNGMKFGVMFNPKGLAETSSDAQIWEVVANDDYGITLPNDVLFPSVGDKYVLVGWDSTKIAELGLVEKAEKRLEHEAMKYVAKTSIDDGTYDTTLDSTWVYDDMINRSFDVGQRINLVHPAFMKNGRSSRVLGFEIKLDFPFDSPHYTIGESSAYSRFADIEGKLEATTFKGQTYMSVGTGGGSSVYLIKTNDMTAASNFNAFSALRSLAMFIRKDAPDTTQQILTFAKGLLVGSNGSGIEVLGDGTTQAVVDRLYVKMKAVFDELQIKRKTQVGGEQILSHAGIKCTSVEDFEGYYRCYFLSELDGERIVNEFSLGSFAQSQSCNIEGKNRFYWREVVGIGANYIDLSKSSCANDSDIPMSGDDIIAVGHTTDNDLQSVIVMSSVNENSPSITFYAGINDFSYTDKDIFTLGYDKSLGRATLRLYGDAYIGARDKSTFVRYTEEKGVEVNGVVEFKKGSKGWENIEGLPEEIKKASEHPFEDIRFGKYNLLVNSGFNGDYVTRQINEDTEFNEEDDVFSTALDYWVHSGVVVQDSEVSQSGREAVLVSGKLSQTIDAPTIIGENYIFSFKAKGKSITISGGGYVEEIPLTDTFQKYTRKFLCAVESAEVSFSGDCTICELQLEIGTVPSAWGYNIKDNNSAIAYYQNLVYLASALKNGSTSILGGLVLSSMIQLGNYSNGVLKDVTAVLSGIYNDEDDVLLSGGGNLEKAIYTVGLFRDNPEYQPTDDELKRIANVVITHGGRAILSDAVIRGTIYAKGGLIGGWNIDNDGIFKNNVRLGADGTISNGVYWSLNNDGSGSLASSNIVWDSDGNITFGESVTLAFGSVVDGKIGKKLTKIDSNGIYTGTISADKITSGTISTATIKQKDGLWELNSDGSGQLCNNGITWDKEGNLSVTGEINAKIGNIGGFTINANSLENVHAGDDSYGASIYISNSMGTRFCRLNGGAGDTAASFRNDGGTAVYVFAYGDSTTTDSTPTGIKVTGNGTSNAIHSTGTNVFVSRESNSERTYISGLAVCTRTGNSFIATSNSRDSRFPVGTNVDFLVATGEVTLPGPSDCLGRIIFVRRRNAGSSKLYVPNCYLADGSFKANASWDDEHSRIFISDGNYWNEFYCK